MNQRGRQRERDSKALQGSLILCVGSSVGRSSRVPFLPNPSFAWFVTRLTYTIAGVRHRLLSQIQVPGLLETQTQSFVMLRLRIREDPIHDIRAQMSCRLYVMHVIFHVKCVKCHTDLPRNVLLVLIYENKYQKVLFFVKWK